MLAVQPGDSWSATTLTLISLDILSRTPDMPAEERAEAVAYADAEARRLSRIVGELLTLARADAGQTLERRSVELDRVLFWQALGSLKWGVMCLMMYSSYAAGAESSVERPMIGRRVSETEIDLINLLEAGL